MNRTEAFNILEERKITSVVVCYTGGNDEGGVDEIILNHEDGSESKMEEWYDSPQYNTTTKKYEYNNTPTKDEQLSEFLCSPVYDSYGSFAGDFYVNGEIHWDVKTRKGTMSSDFETRFTESSEQEV